MKASERGEGVEWDEFEEIYRTYFADVYRYIKKLSGSGQTADDITSETFLKAMDAMGSFRGGCSIKVWLCQIAKNLYFSQLQKERRIVPDEDVELSEDPGSSPEDEYVRRAEALRIQEILHSLGETYREVFMWRVFAELSFRQIGGLFGKSQNWACVTYHRARSLIKKRMEEDDHEK